MKSRGFVPLALELNAMSTAVIYGQPPPEYEDDIECEESDKTGEVEAEDISGLFTCVLLLMCAPDVCCVLRCHAALGRSASLYVDTS
jgi:hypothetical protein